MGKGGETPSTSLRAMEPTGSTLEWVTRAVGARVRGRVGLNAGGAPWLVRFDGGRPDLVLRVGGPDDAGTRERFTTETAALRLVERHGLPAMRLVAARPDDGDQLALLTTVVPGSSTIPREATTERLRNLGAAAGAIASVRPGAGHGLGHRARPIESVDFALLRRSGSTPLLDRADAVMARLPRPEAEPVLVHGDLWQANLMWDGDAVVGLIDWDCAGVGHHGVDLGSARLDAALMFGQDAVVPVLDGWRAATGRDPGGTAYWDVVAALSTPTDLGYFMPVIHRQGRGDLTRELAVERRDTFLRAALDSLCGQVTA